MVCDESPRALVDAILAMRVDPGQQRVAGKLTGASTSGPATAAGAAKTRNKCGPAGESAGPATFLQPLAGTQQGDAIPLRDLQVADQVEVWSHTAQRWLPAVVESVHDDDTLVVAFHVDQVGERLKDLPRFSAELRPFWPTRGEG